MIINIVIWMIFDIIVAYKFYTLDEPILVLAVGLVVFSKGAGIMSYRIDHKKGE